MVKEKILVVEDEEDILELIQYNLVKESYKVSCVTSGEDGLKMAQNQNPDLVLLDLMLPGVDGLDVCKNLKGNPSTSKIPVIIISAKGEEADVVTGLEMGADDYMTKPFSPRILLSRIKAVLRRVHEPVNSEDRVLEFRDLVIHPGKHEVRVQGEPAELTYTEFRILLIPGAGCG